jgi:N-acetylmuramic acid 6-phosphate etherase
VFQENKDILIRLGIEPSARSIDYVTDKKQFQLHTLLTEQRHPKTWNLSSTIQKDITEGLIQIFSVDEDIIQKFNEMTQDTALIERAAQAAKRAIQKNRKIYIYGCGSTGRLAKQLESAVWRPFWRKVRQSGLWDTLQSHLPEDIEDRLIGEMTGGDRALISALESFEDLELIGELQLLEREIEKGDVVFCITEGGETSSVLGTIKAALQLYKPLNHKNTEEAKKHLFFIYNNPDDLLQPLDRSRSVIENPAISRINLTTGPQAIAGSTRMQATTAETFIMGVILEAAIHGLLQEFLTVTELSQLGFGQKFSIKDRILTFRAFHTLIMESIEPISHLTRLESNTYREGRRATYFAGQALLPVFIDCAERSPTFHLDPLDTILETENKCWLQVWTGAETSKKAWQLFLGRNFRGLEERLYGPRLEAEIKDPYLKKTSMNSLAQAGSDQEKMYDFSFSERNIIEKGPERGDLGVITCIDEEIEELAHPNSTAARFMRLFKRVNARVAVVSVGKKAPHDAEIILEHLSLEKNRDTFLHIPLAGDNDPLQLNRQIFLKILFNGHSTGVMARLGRVVGNTMTSVKPSNLKLIGRATALIVSHVNDTISQKKWSNSFGRTESISYAQANAVLIEAMDYVSKKGGLASEVELSIIRILEALRRHSPISWDEALSILQKEGLENHLTKLNPAQLS